MQQQIIKRVFKFEQTLKDIVRNSDIISESELVRLTGIKAPTINMYFTREEFSHIKKYTRPKRFEGITETDLARLKDLTTRRFNRKTKTENGKSR